MSSGWSRWGRWGRAVTRRGMGLQAWGWSAKAWNVLVGGEEREGLSQGSRRPQGRGSIAGGQAGRRPVSPLPAAVVALLPLGARTLPLGVPLRPHALCSEAGFGRYGLCLPWATSQVRAVHRGRGLAGLLRGCRSPRRCWWPLRGFGVRLWCGPAARFTTSPRPEHSRPLFECESPGPNRLPSASCPQGQGAELGQPPGPAAAALNGGQQGRVGPSPGPLAGSPPSPAPSIPLTCFLGPGPRTPRTRGSGWCSGPPSPPQP